jgi:hypothetical protein
MVKSNLLNTQTSRVVRGNRNCPHPSVRRYLAVRLGRMSANFVISVFIRLSAFSELL